MLTQNLDTEDLNLEKLNPFEGAWAYSQNKRAQVCLTEKWAEDNKDSGILFQRHGFFFFN